MKNYTQETKAPWYPKAGSILSITTGPLQTIGSYAFSQCKAITSITIPSTVTRINTKAFEGCSEVTSLKYPRSEIITANDIFEGCSKLTKITITGTGNMQQYSSENQPDRLSRSRPYRPELCPYRHGCPCKSETC